MRKAGKVGIVGVFALLLAALWGSAAMAAQTVTGPNFANAPQGTHFAGRTSLTECTVTATSVTCPAEAFQLAGVGNTDATAELTATYTATVDCFNPGVNPNNPVESHTQTVTPPPVTQNFEATKNGRLTVTPITSTTPTEAQFQAEATCPNPNWTPLVRPGSITLTQFTYTLTFDGFNEPFVTITGTAPF